MLLYLAGLQAIDPHVIEAAQLDGAGAVRTCCGTSPGRCCVPITAAIVLLGMRDTMQGFQIFLIMTNGGPGGHTDVLGLQTYQLAFFQSLSPTLGVASALGWLIFAGRAAAHRGQRPTAAEQPMSRSAQRGQRSSPIVAR